MTISKAHQRFADRLENQRALDHPEEFLGPNWKDVLNFWFFLDTLTEEQQESIKDSYYSLSSDERSLAAELAAWDAASDAAAGDDAWDAASYAAYVSAAYAAAYATCEIMGSHILQEQGKSLVFFPLFLNP